jgi:glutamine---fructose-6-phosphate transaminase (isomerizing)
MTTPRPPGSTTSMAAEAAEIPEAVARQLAANRDACRDLACRLRRQPPRFAATGARGSSDNAATFAKYLIETRLGLPVASLGPSVSSVYDAPLRLDGALFLAISQSGRSPDLLSLARTARRGNALTLALVNDAASPLAQLCERSLPLHAGPERSVAATKSFVASLAAVLQLVAFWTGDRDLLLALDRLPDDLHRAARIGWTSALGAFDGVKGLFVLGRGPGMATAQEAALKFKEACRLHAEAYSAAEVMHGPMALARPGFPTLAFGQEDGAWASVSLAARRMAEAGSPVLVAGPAPVDGTLALPVLSGLHPVCAPLAATCSFYPLVHDLALSRGLDPDRPPHLRKITETL